MNRSLMLNEHPVNHAPVAMKKALADPMNVASPSEVARIGTRPALAS